ncbi:hypothetical protein NL676_012508 [Syzygium grande]|nr:hypothetical protein NL676_012508 [Syzygium grande]
MGFELLDWYCGPVASGIWARTTDSAFGAYTPCAVDSLVISISHLVLLGLCCYRIWLIKRTSKVHRYRLRSKCYNYMLGLLSFYCAAEPLLRLVMGFSVFNLDGHTIVLPYEMVSLTIESLAWCSMLVMVGLEMHAYIREFKWYVKFGLIYVLVGQAVMLNLILSIRDHYQHHRSALYLYISMVFCQVIFGILLFVYVRIWTLIQGILRSTPSLLVVLNTRLFQERSKFVLKGMSTYFPIQEMLGQRVSKAQTMAFKSFEQQPWGRFWLGGFFKIGSDLSEFAGPTLLNYLLQSMQRGDPAWIGYICALFILVSVSFGVLCEAQYFQNAFRTGFRLRSTLGRKKFQSGKITNMITTDANTLEQICRQLHNLWSAPFRIVVAMVLLYQQLGTVINSKMRKFTKEGLQWTDKSVSLMNEILAAMDTVKYVD